MERKKLKNEKGSVLVLAIIALAISGIGLLGASYVSKTGLDKEVLMRLESLVKRDVLYLDKDKVIGALSDYDVFVTLKTADGDYALARILEGKLENGEYLGEVSIEYPNGELATGDFKNYLPEIILKDGVKTYTST